MWNKTVWPVELSETSLCVRAGLRWHIQTWLTEKSVFLQVVKTKLNMRKEFNTTGSCNPEWHYMVDTEKRFKAVEWRVFHHQQGAAVREDHDAAGYQ